MSAMRNLNRRDLHGRPLKVNNATSEKYRVRFEKFKKMLKIIDLILGGIFNF